MKIDLSETLRNIHIKINWGSLGKRLGFGLGAAASVASLQPALLTSRTGLLSLAVTGLAAMVPVAPGSTGILHPAQPGTTSLADAAVVVMTAPAAQRQAQADALKAQAAEALKAIAAQAGAEAAQAILNKTNMEGFSAGQLGTAAAAITPGADAAIAQTGGPQ